MDVIGVLRGKYWTPAFALKFGETAIRNCLRDQLKFLRDESLKCMGKHPMVFTEIGIPYDMDDKHAYKTGDYSSQTRAMDANHFAIEGSGSNGFTLWLYETENNHKWGDNWNGEDLSIFSNDDLELPTGKADRSTDQNSPSYSESYSSGGELEVGPRNIKGALAPPSISTDEPTPPAKGYRAAEAFLRPSPIYVSGALDTHVFDLENCRFSMTLTAQKATPTDAPTEIFLPDFHFPPPKTVTTVSGGKWEIDTFEIQNVKLQRLRWWHAEGEQYIHIEGVKRQANEFTNPSGEDVTYFEQCQKGQCLIM